MNNWSAKVTVVTGYNTGGQLGRTTVTVHRAVSAADRQGVVDELLRYAREELGLGGLLDDGTCRTTFDVALL